MEIVLKKLKEIKPYEKNPRKNDEAVEYVANSIREFGFKVPIVIDKNGVIVAGHTRYKASLQLGLDSVPCIVADDLTDEQIKAFRLADNKVSEKAEWDFSMLDEELKDLTIDMSEFGFESFDVNPENFIDDLLQTELVDHKVDAESFSVTFVFDIESKEVIDEYLKKYGKEKIVSKIVEWVKEDA